MIAEPEKLRRTLSTNIKKQRKILRISQEKLAEAADLSAQTINDIEGCRMWVSDKTMIKLSLALNIEVYQLLIPDIEVEVPAMAAEPPAVAEEPVPALPDILRALRKNIKKGIDLQFNELLKAGTLRP